jgi:hypothetical protein
MEPESTAKTGFRARFHFWCSWVLLTWKEGMEWWRVALVGYCGDVGQVVILLHVGHLSKVMDLGRCFRVVQRGVPDKMMGSRWIEVTPCSSGSYTSPRYLHPPNLYISKYHYDLLSEWLRASYDL